MLRMLVAVLESVVSPVDSEIVVVSRLVFVLLAAVV